MSNYNSAGLERGRAKAAALFVVTLVGMLAAAYAATADFSGKWSGSSPDKDSMGPVYAILRQEGSTLTGSAGPSESKQFPITSGKVDGDRLAFEIKMGGGTIRFDLTGAASELRGTAQILEDDGHTASANVVFKRVP
jgi:hypothetical protein